MDVLTLIVALIALILASLAYARTGGLAALHVQADDMRERTADLLERFEHAVRTPKDGSEETDDHTKARTAKPVDRPPRASA